MKRREMRMKRRRENVPAALSALIQLIPQDTDPRKFLEDTYAVPAVKEVAAHSKDDDADDAIVEGEKLAKLVEDLGVEACPDGVYDLVRLTRSVPRSRSSVHVGLHVAELCFAISQATGPTTVHERRRAEGCWTEPLDDSTALLRHYKGARFSAIIRGEDPSARAVGEDEASAAIGDEQDAAEWDSFIKCMETALPMSLRLHRNERVFERVARDALTNPDSSIAMSSGSLNKDTYESTDTVANVVRPVEVMPRSTGLYACSNADYHANKRAELICRTLHAASAVSFQEVVSAIPVTVLDVQPHHSVIELCAAPGSKTLQTLDEMLKGGWTKEVVKGVMIASEKDRIKATQTLPARLKRYHAPNVLCVRCDGTQWPRLYTSSADHYSQKPPHSDEAGVVEKVEEPPLQERRFDRVICDVPCSGDGTLRKERSVATTWSAGYVKSLVPIQRALLRRGLDLLADDGILVYSTCSMNPKEDEEVVCAGLELFGDSVELIDVNAVLCSKGAHLHSSGGIHTPNVEGLQNPVVPPTYDGSKVLRVLPHRDNTGGFFVAAFRKVKQPDWNAPSVVRHKLNQWTKGKLWSPVASDDPNWRCIADFYGFDRMDKKSFSYLASGEERRDGGAAPAAGEKEEEEQGLVPVYHLNPNGAPSRRIVLATRGLADMLFHTRPYKGPGVELVSAGVRAFEAYDGKFLSEAQCRWRAVVESASFFAPRCSARKLLLCADRHAELLKELLQNGFVLLRDHIGTILVDASVNSLCSGTGVTGEGCARYPFVKSGQLESALDRGEAGLSQAAELLMGSVHVGGILLGIAKNKADAESSTGPWFVSATLSSNKLELAVDAALRAFGLMAYFGVLGLGATPAEQPTAANDADDANGRGEPVVEQSSLQ